ncbi:MAG TPA: nucleotidyl transferase AbiEii/AbiGii toxin family protein, partial [Candidatus Methylacidiphilales bacterium]
MKDSVRHYATASAFRVALETRLKAMEKAEGIGLQRLRRQVSFDRLLARFFSERPCPWLLKGGYAMELRVHTARNTKDVDLSLPAGTTADVKGHVLERLRARAGVDLGDFFTFTIGEPMMDLDAAPEGGARYP